MCERLLVIAALLAWLGLGVVHAAQPQDCHGKICTADQYCSPFNDKCETCDEICNQNTHNFHQKDCQAHCPDYGKEILNLEAELKWIRVRQYITIALLSLLVLIVAIRYGISFRTWLRQTKRWATIRNKLVENKSDVKPNECNQLPPLHIPQYERPSSQIYSVTGMEGSTILTVTTPVSTRYPVEDSTEEYSYDNAGLQVTPVVTKPSTTSSGALPI